MNERIKELMNDAVLEVEDINDAGETIFWTTFDKEKFAESIIRECCAAIESTDRYRADYFIAKIKEHFGVEE